MLFVHYKVQIKRLKGELVLKFNIFTRIKDLNSLN
jgi:hypothetical protein